MKADRSDGTGTVSGLTDQAETRANRTLVMF